MLANLARNWWVLAILFGTPACVWPGLTGLTLVWLFGAYTFLLGVLLIIIVAFRLCGLWPPRRARPALLPRS
jgi:uncharacterized membrane protein HdeD (DUF308 family)